LPPAISPRRTRHIPSPELERLLEDLAFEAADRDAIRAAARRADELARSLSKATAPSEVAHAVATAGPELVALAGALGAAQQARQWLDTFRHIKLEIDGNDLIAAGVPQGQGIGTALRAALAAKLDGDAPTREAELTAALEALRATE
jgi:tRNA nucleotidyltransferase (CCA-adding enzyme)